MGKVQLKIPPWIASLLAAPSDLPAKARQAGLWQASMLKAQGSDWLILEPEIGEGATVGGLLLELTSSHTGFRKVVFNPDVGEVSDQLMVLLNDNLMQDSDITETKLNDGDSIMLLPVYAGG